MLSPSTGGNTGQQQGTAVQQEGARPKGFEARINISQGGDGSFMNSSSNRDISLFRVEDDTKVTCKRAALM